MEVDEILQEQSHAGATVEVAEPWAATGHQVAFLSSYAVAGSITRAAEAAGISRQTHYAWLKQFPEYVTAFADARTIAIDILEERAIERARDGWDEPVYHDGKQCGTIRKHSDRLIEFLIKYNKPDVYKDRRELTGKDGAPLLNLPMMDRILAEGDEE